MEVDPSKSALRLTFNQKVSDSCAIENVHMPFLIFRRMTPSPFDKKTQTYTLPMRLKAGHGLCFPPDFQLEAVPAFVIPVCFTTRAR